MLGSLNIVAFVPTRDSDKAKAFYEGVLGLRFVKDDGFALVLDANGITIRVAKVPDFKPAQFTILGWQVSDIESVVRGLQKEGVHFEIFGFFSETILEFGLLPRETRSRGSRIPTRMSCRCRSMPEGACAS